MKKFLIAMMAVMFLIIGGMTAVEAGGSIYASKVIGDTGMAYEANLDETVSNFNLFAHADFSSDVDGISKIYTDEISGGMSFEINDALSIRTEYSENYRGDNTIEKLDLSSAYTFGNGFSVRPKVERNVTEGDNKYMIGAGYAW